MTTQIAETESNAVPGSLSITRTAFIAPKILRFAVDINILAAIRLHVLRCIDAIHTAPDSTQAIYKAQGGIRLSEIQSAAILLLTAQLQQIVGQPCDLSKCSVRLQKPDGDQQLRWHQDYAPMKLEPDEDGVVAWVPLDPIDGTRPTLEIAKIKAPFSHHHDALGFLVSSWQGFDGRVLTDMAVGDIALFSPYAPHRTVCLPEMKNSRLSLDMRFSDKWR